MTRHKVAVAIRITSPHHSELIESPPPPLAPNQVLVRVQAVGICKSDVEVWHGTRPAPYVKYPVQLGHEWCGTIEQVGAKVNQLHVGQRVAVEGLNYCGKCFYCKRGETNLCETYNEFGFTLPGGYAEYVAVRADLAHPFDRALAYEHAALCEPASCVAHGIERANIQAGDTVVIIGPGTIGLLAAAWARLFDAAQIVVMGENRMNESLALAMGATHYFTIQENQRARVLELTNGRGADVVIEAAGSPQAFASAFDLVRRGGTIVVEGIAGGGKQIPFEPDQLVLQDVRVHGVFSYASRHFEKTLRLIENGKLNVQPLVTHTFPLADFRRAFDLLEQRTERVGKVLLKP